MTIMSNTVQYAANNDMQQRGLRGVNLDIRYQTYPFTYNCHGEVRSTSNKYALSPQRELRCLLRFVGPLASSALSHGPLLHIMQLLLHADTTAQ